MEDIEKIKSKVLEKIKPGKESEKKLLEIFREIKQFIFEKFGLESDIMGSVAKNTFLEGEYDLDIFLFFNPEIKREDMEKKALMVGAEVFRKFGAEYFIDYAEHPYAKGKIKDVLVEIVPCYKISEIKDMKSAVDRTPFHKKWVLNNLNEIQKDEVRILKAFLKAQGIYGSSLKILGFSGYLCEVLIAQYGSFENLVKEAVSWKFNEVIDPANYYKKGEAKLRFKEPLIVVDPVDKNRNVASVLSEENYSKFIFSAWKFSENPSMRFFFPRKRIVSIKKVEEELKKHGKIFVFEFEKPKLIEDVLYPQLRKVERKALQFLKFSGFKVLSSSFHVNEKIIFGFEIECDKLPLKEKRTGPFLYKNFGNVRRFIEKYKNVWIENGRVNAFSLRKNILALNCLQEFFIKEESELIEKGIPANLAKFMCGGKIYEIKPGEKLKEEVFPLLKKIMRLES